MNSKPVVAMGLGGLGGFNAHDAGVLAAAHECGLEPDIITCTSGAIFWTELFLTNPGGIRDEVEQQAEAVSGANTVQVAVLGDPGVFQPAYASWWRRWFAPPSGRRCGTCSTACSPPSSTSPPARRRSSPRSPRTSVPHAGHVQRLRRHQRTGAGLLQPGRVRLPRIVPRARAPARHPGRGHLDGVPAIDADAVRSALWLTLYGFSNRYAGETAIDPAALLELLRRKAAELHRRLRAGPADLSARPGRNLGQR